MEKLNAALPPYWSHSNPVDVLGDAPSDRFIAAVRLPWRLGVNGLIVIYTPQGNARPDDMAEGVVDLKTSAKPVIAVLMGGDNV